MIRARTDDAAFDALVRRHQRAVLRAAFRFFGDRADAEDAAQQAFLEVHRARHTYAPRGKFRAFLFHVLHNQCLMIVRREKSRERVVEVAAAAAASSVVVDAEPHQPDASLAHADDRARIEALADRALRALSDTLRVVVVMHYFGEAPYADIAAELDIPLGTVKSRLSEAKAQIRKALEENHP